MEKNLKDIAGKLANNNELKETKIPETPVAEEQNTTAEEPEPSIDEIKNIAAEQPESGAKNEAAQPEATANSEPVANSDAAANSEAAAAAKKEEDADAKDPDAVKATKEALSESATKDSSTTVKETDSAPAESAPAAESTETAKGGRKAAPAPADRAELLKRNLVTAYKTDKAKNDALEAEKVAAKSEDAAGKKEDPVSAAVPDANLKKKEKETEEAKAGKATKSEGGETGKAATKPEGSGAGKTTTAESKEEVAKKEESAEGSKEEEEKKSPLAAMLGYGKALIGSVYKNYKNRKKIKESKTVDKKKGARREFWKSIGDTVKNLSGGATSGLKAFGSEESQSLGGKIIDAFTSAAGSVGSFMSMAAGISAKREHKKIAGSAQSWIDKVKGTSAEKEKELSKSVKSARGTADYGAKRKERNDFKAKKYAMSMARDFNKIKGDQMVKGGFGFATSLLGTAKKGMAFASKSFLSSEVGTGLKMGMDALSSVLGKIGEAVEKKSDDKAAKANKDTQLKHIDDYITSRSSKLDVGEDVIFKGIAEDEKENYGKGELTDNEKARIVIARLGVDVEITDEALTDEEKMAAFKLLAMKRAKNILNASPDTKKAMLRSLGLGESATAEDVVASMIGE